MKKIGLISLALVLTLGALGVGYAAWTDTIYINGSVSTGSLCMEFEPGGVKEASDCDESINNPGQEADMNWDGWIRSVGSVSCPQNHKFDDKFCSDKDIATVSWVYKDLDGDTLYDRIEFTINNAYPHYLAWVGFEMCNCGTIPVRLKKAEFEQSTFLVIEYRNGVGEQIEPGNCKEVSFYVGVVQHEGYFDGLEWIVDDPNEALLPENTPLTFSIDIEAIQFDQY
jgi:hypothetical protein